MQYKSSIVALFLLTNGCTAPRNTEISPRQATVSEERPNLEAGDLRSQINYQQNDRATVPVSMQEEHMQQTFQVNTAALSYKFAYLSSQKEGPIEFIDGVAKLIFKGLEVNKSGTLSLLIYEQGKPVIKGEVKGLALRPGANAQKIRLVKIDGSSDEDLDIGQQTQVTYQAVKPILDAACVRCHSQQGTARGNVLLDQFPFKITNTRKFPDVSALMTRLIDTIANANSSMPMPRGGQKLSSAQIELIERWNREGLKP